MMMFMRAIICILFMLLQIILVSPVLASVPHSDAKNLSTYDKGYRFDENGWIYVHIEGEPYERGFQYGYLTAPELDHIMRSIRYLTPWNTGMDLSFFAQAGVDLFMSQLDQEYQDEIRGIADGAEEAGVNVSWQEILAWNGYSELIDYWWPKHKDGSLSDRIVKGHCSAFIATGNATRNGEIVIAHNTWECYERGQFYNVILDIKPSRGHSIFMQSVPGYLDSFTDFFMTDAGLVGTETTIGGFEAYSPGKAPEFYRVRKAMQYANNLDDFAAIMKENNSGGLADSWLLGDINSGEIMRFELGLNYSNVSRTQDGYFIGFNSPLDPRIRNLECSETGYADIRHPHGARQVRLAQLMKQYCGKIDVESAKIILADHYDVYLDKINPSSRTVDGHYELDPLEYLSLPDWSVPFSPDGTVDGKASNSSMARNLSFSARWGSSSGMPFNATSFLEEHIQWSHLNGHLLDRPTQPWTVFRSREK
jgi:hypothetical protein